MSIQRISEIQNSSENKELVSVGDKEINSTANTLIIKNKKLIILAITLLVVSLIIFLGGLGCVIGGIVTTSSFCTFVGIGLMTASVLGFLVALFLLWKIHNNDVKSINTMQQNLDNAVIEQAAGIGGQQDLVIDLMNEQQELLTRNQELEKALELEKELSQISHDNYLSEFEKSRELHRNQDQLFNRQAELFRENKQLRQENEQLQNENLFLKKEKAILAQGKKHVSEQAMADLLKRVDTEIEKSTQLKKQLEFLLDKEQSLVKSMQENRRLMNQNQAALKKVSVLEEEKKSLQEKLTQLNLEKFDLQELIKNKDILHQNNISFFEQTIKAYKEEIRALQEHQGFLEDEVSSLQAERTPEEKAADLRVWQEKIMTAQQKEQALQTRINALQSKIVAMNEQCLILMDTQSKLEAHLGTQPVQMEIEKMRQLEELDAEIETKHSFLQNIEAQLVAKERYLKRSKPVIALESIEEASSESDSDS